MIFCSIFFIIHIILYVFFFFFIFRFVIYFFFYVCAFFFLFFFFFFYFFFFFQAEDGIRDVAVTGVQTCALPISRNISDFLREQAEMFLGADFLQAHRVLVALSQRRLYFTYLGGDRKSVV